MERGPYENWRAAGLRANHSIAARISINHFAIRGQPTRIGIRRRELPTSDGQSKGCRYGAVDAGATRVPTSEIVRALLTMAPIEPVKRKLYIPLLAEWFRAIRNSLER